MTINFFQTPEYRAIMEEHLSKTIGYLFEKDKEFAIACQVKHLTFTPELPKEIQESFKETVLFILSGYTYQSAKLEDDLFSFEAGFGNENFGSVVTVPLLAIKQIFVGDTPILLNHADLAYQKTVEQKESQKSSMEALLNNPKNKKLLKKSK